MCAAADTEQKYARPTGFIGESLAMVSIPFNHLSSRTFALEEIGILILMNRHQAELNGLRRQFFCDGRRCENCLSLSYWQCEEFFLK